MITHSPQLQLIKGFYFMTFDYVKQSLSGPGQALQGSKRWRLPGFVDNRYVNVAKLSAISTGRHYPQEITLVHIYVWCWVDSRIVMRPEGLSQWKIPMNSPGIEPATLRLVAQCLNQLQHRVPQPSNKASKFSEINFKKLKDTNWKFLDIADE